VPTVAKMLRAAARLQRWARRDRAGPSALIIAPTRELAQQIHSQLELLLACAVTGAGGAAGTINRQAGRGGALRTACVLGGQVVSDDPELLSALFR
jgi:superfamily II DNA/RNA helicase